MDQASVIYWLTDLLAECFRGVGELPAEPIRFNASTGIVYARTEEIRKCLSYQRGRARSGALLHREAREAFENVGDVVVSGCFS